MAFSKQKRIEIHSKYNGKCAYCGEDILLKDMQIDHIIPQEMYIKHVRNKFRIPTFLSHLTEADMNHDDNLNPSCRVCNKWKSCHDLELFRRELSEQVKRLNERSSNYRIVKKYNQIEEVVKPIVFYFETIKK